MFQSGLLAQAVTKLVLPDTVTIIEDGNDIGGQHGAFMGIGSPDKIILSKTLRIIGSYAFASYNASGKSIIIPKSVQEIHSHAFLTPSYASSRRFENVYYEGTQEEWNSIAIGSDNGMLTDATIHYNYQPE